MTCPAFALAPFNNASQTATTQYCHPAACVLDDRSNASSILVAPPPLPSDAPIVMRTGLEFATSIAAVLPLNEEADKRIDALFARQPTRKPTRAVARR